jgi:hypothetical protein
MILKAHFDTLEQCLLTNSATAANAGHPNHKCFAREAFIQTFLKQHLSETVAIGTGEVIDCNSTVDQGRNQHDVVIYKRNYPRLCFGGSIHAFLVESVIATIEVKSELTKAGLRQAIEAARAVKSLQSKEVTHLESGHQQPAIPNYVVAYEGPKRIETVYGWVKSVHSELQISTEGFQGHPGLRPYVPSPSIDGVFILGQGSLLFGNSLRSLTPDEVWQQNRQCVWEMGEWSKGNLLLLFLRLTEAASRISIAYVDPHPYLGDWTPQSIQLGD